MRLFLFFSVALLSFVSMGFAANFSKNDELVIALNNEPPQLIPAVHSGTLPGILGSQLFAGLVRCDESGRPLPYLAKSWKVSEGGRRVEFFLRKNAFFHDGQPITSQDVLFSYQVVRKKHPFYSMLKPVDRVELTGKYSIAFSLNAPYSSFFKVCTVALFPILPRHIYQSSPKLLEQGWRDKVVGSGPFYLEQYDFGKQIVLRAFPNFFLPGRPYLKKLTFLIFSGPDEIAMALEAGEVQLAAFSPSLRGAEAVIRPENIVVSQDGFTGIGAMLGLEFNLREKPFNDPRVRHAFSLAIDRDFLVNNILGGSARKMDGPYIPSLPFYTPLPSEDHQQDLVKANRLLDAAGYPRDSHGKRMKVTVISLPNARSLTRPLLEYLRYTLGRDLGVDLFLWETPDLKTWGDEVSSGNFQASLDIAFTWSDPLIGLHRLYSANNIRKGVTWSNITGYKRKEVATIFSLIENGRLSEQEKFDGYRRVEQLLREDLPILWLATMPYETLYDRRVHGVNEDFWGMLSPMDTIYWDFSQKDMP